MYKVPKRYENSRCINFTKTRRRTVVVAKVYFHVRSEARASPGEENYLKKWENMCTRLFALVSDSATSLFRQCFKYIFSWKICRHILSILWNENDRCHIMSFVKEKAKKNYIYICMSRVYIYLNLNIISINRMISRWITKLSRFQVNIFLIEFFIY